MFQATLLKVSLFSVCMWTTLYVQSKGINAQRKQQLPTTLLQILGLVQSLGRSRKLGQISEDENYQFQSSCLEEEKTKYRTLRKPSKQPNHH